MTNRSTLAALGVLAMLAACSNATPPPRIPEPPAAGPQEYQAPPAPPAVPTRDYPESRRDDVVDRIHGTLVRDPYRWLEDPTRPEVQAWMKAEDRYARERLAKLPARDALAARFAEVFYYDEIDAPEHRGGRLFYLRKHKDREKAIVHWRQGEHGAEQVLLDPNTWSTDGSAGLRGWWPSSTGRYVAFNRSEHNADETTLGVIDVATGKLLPDAIAGTKYGRASWAGDRGFYYVWVPPAGPQVPVADRPGFAELRYHALGSDPAHDPVLREATHDPQTLVDITASRDGHWLFAEVHHGWNSSDLYFQDPRQHGKGWTTLVEGVPALFAVAEFQDVFYVRTNDGAPRYRMFAVDPRHPARADWKQIVAESDATLQSSAVIGGSLVLDYLRSAASEVEIHDLHGALVRKVALPPLGDASPMRGLPDDDDGYISYTSFTEPHVVYKVSIRRGSVAEWARVQLPIDLSQFTTEQVRYPSKDGTEITMFLVHRKDAVKDGKTPVYLTGYGGFNAPALPGFVSSRSSWAAHAVWMEHGGMVAVPNLRGGNEYGEQWHKAGMLLEKQHVFDDFLAAARWLIASGWTGPEHLAISGGSNGGLLVGAALTQAPELFKAVVCEVPLLDMVRYHLFGSGKTWAPEYGSAEDAAQFQALFAYSPYHRIQRGVRYPAVLMSSADHDDRVDPMHARKFTAALQWASAGDGPVWLRIQANAGHAGVDQVKQKIEQNADTYAFLMWQLGMK
ncbi:MAG TPA: prolyl oligopeptidase family serine peptidase [Kofleriaceae bacterium]|jgi:prolyl oligopeptidase|nr:prolyl oligopeptidase family serine peptidase [Kofleriaceae bacterium]